MAASNDKTTAWVRKHLEFLGYSSILQDDGWMFASHPTRPDVCFRTVPFGVRMVALFDLGRPSDTLRAEWVDFANRCNNVGIFVRFALGTRDDGGYLFRATAVFHGEYARASFGAFIDAWQSDLALMAHAPSGPEPMADEGDEEGGRRDAGEVRH